jgi:hypothetical protein
MAGQEGAVARLQRLVAALVGVSLALVAALAYTTLGGADPGELARTDEGVREAAVRELVESGAGIWDSYQDPDVGRVLQPGLVEREYEGAVVSSNELGMREVEYAARKEPGTTRVVLLGDSYVFGQQVGADQRVGAHLAELLRTRAGAGGPVEVLHVAVSSWNILAECSYLRRQLGLLRPDLVVQVIIQNDLGDTKGPRGFGSVGAYSPQVRRRANGLVSLTSHRTLWPAPTQNHLLRGVDHESRARYALAAQELRRLRDAVEAVGGRYLLVGAWGAFNPMVEQHFAPLLEPDQLAYLSSDFSGDARVVIDPGNQHWNPEGHALVARFLYGLAVERGLLPGLQLAPWPEAAALVESIHVPGLAEARSEGWARTKERQNRRDIAPRLDLGRLDVGAVKQVYGGIDADGYVAPYASLVLANAGSELRVRGRGLGRPELAGAHAEVWVEELRVGELPLAQGELDVGFVLPAELADRPYLNVRFESDDWVYRNVRRGNCVTFVLASVELR